MPSEGGKGRGICIAACRVIHRLPRRGDTGKEGGGERQSRLKPNRTDFLAHPSVKPSAAKLNLGPQSLLGASLKLLDLPMHHLGLSSDNVNSKMLVSDKGRGTKPKGVCRRQETKGKGDLCVVFASLSNHANRERRRRARRIFRDSEGNHNVTAVVLFRNVGTYLPG